MRIISGKYKGRIITPPKNLPVRPTTDMAKESLFNILRNYIDLEDKSVLDLFAGTGNLTFEFVSRGCKNVDSIDKDNGCVKFIKQNIDKLNIENVKVTRLDVFRFLKISKNKYHLIFADPPYSLAGIDTIPSLILSSDILHEEGLLVLEHPKDYDFSSTNGFIEHRKYGSVNFSFFVKN